jgi:hypothetical protein
MKHVTSSTANVTSSTVNVTSSTAKQVKKTNFTNTSSALHTEDSSSSNKGNSEQIAQSKQKACKGLIFGW